jgi:hypothetical protein
MNPKPNYPSQSPQSHQVYKLARLSHASSVDANPMPIGGRRTGASLISSLSLHLHLVSLALSLSLPFMVEADSAAVVL